MGGHADHTHARASQDGETKTTRPSSDDEPMSALAFKIMTDPFVGALTFARMYSGVLNKVVRLGLGARARAGARVGVGVWLDPDP